MDGCSAASDRSTARDSSVINLRGSDMDELTAMQILMHACERRIKAIEDAPHIRPIHIDKPTMVGTVQDTLNWYIQQHNKTNP